MMKSKLYFVLLICIVLSFAGCQKEPEATTEAFVIDDSTSLAEGVMTYEQVKTAKEDQPVVVDVTVKEKVNWDKEKADIIANDSEGIYRINRMVCSEEAFAQMTPGSFIRVTGYKGPDGESIIIENAFYELLEE